MDRRILQLMIDLDQRMLSARYIISLQKNRVDQETEEDRTDHQKEK